MRYGREGTSMQLHGFPSLSVKRFCNIAWRMSRETLRQAVARQGSWVRARVQGVSRGGGVARPPPSQTITLATLTKKRKILHYCQRSILEHADRPQERPVLSFHCDFSRGMMILLPHRRVARIMYVRKAAQPRRALISLWVRSFSFRGAALTWE